MKLQEIHIYGYGKLENVSFKSLQDVQVFYGANEAGKSTIMSFIHSILFGFPTKQQAELRYEPKKHSKYGGMIVAEFSTIGSAVIERVKGRAIGDVTVTLPDGTIGGEELLANLLGGIDKNFYQSIFSFGFQGLQNIHNMKGEELGRFLFSAGALGGDKLMAVENDLVSRMEQLFKPGGKKPELNAALTELKELQESLKKAEKESAEYLRLLKEKEEHEQKLFSIQNELDQKNRRLARLKLLKQAMPWIVEGDKLKKNLNDQPVAFPEGGLSRLDSILERERPLLRRHAILAEKIDALEKEAEKSRPDYAFQVREAEILARIESLPFYEQERAKKRELDSRLEEIDAEIERVNNTLNTRFTEENISSSNTGFYIREKAEEIQQQKEILSQKKRRLDESFQEEAEAVKQLEEEIRRLEQETPDEKLHDKNEARLRALKEREKLEEEYRLLKAVGIKGETGNNNGQKRDRLNLFLFGIFFLVILSAGIFQAQWLLAAVGAVGLGMIILMLLRSSAPRDHAPHESEESWVERLVELEKLLAESDGQDGSLLREKVERDKNLLKKLEEAKARLEQQNERFDRVIGSFEEWEKEIVELNNEQSQIVAELKLHDFPDSGKIFDAFLLVERQKQLFQERHAVQTRRDNLIAIQDDVESAFKQLSEEVLAGEGRNLFEIASLLKVKVRRETERNAANREVLAKLSQWKEEEETNAKELEMLLSEKKELFEIAAVSDENAFRQAGNKAMQQKEQWRRLEEVSLQLDVLGVTEKEMKDVLSGMDINEEFTIIQKNIESLNAKQEGLRDQLARVRHNILVLEEGGTYSERLHEYRLHKSAFREKAKEWAKLAIAKELLSKTVEKYKSTRLPGVLRKAEEHLSFLTDGEYTRIIPRASGSGFWIEDKHRTRFTANELSQATAEQVYVSIRLSLAMALNSQYPFPFLLDDSFVNFDKVRTGRMMELIKSISGNQVLFFTCHPHLLEKFEPIQTIHLSFRRKDAKGEESSIVKINAGTVGI
ncbi:AAA family ATPase [Bacillus massilinigeriensis]|uniref:AAA family ATPase n=1 Tax=Bacillus mediterraneensis TaxID=1805474 RepID=UPI0008F959C9|nr:AAA family ATPase [Bacillus mediterraneensis]